MGLIQTIIVNYIGPLPDFGIDNSIKVMEEGGLSVTCSMTDFSLKFYNRLAMRNNNDSRFHWEQSSKFFQAFILKYAVFNNKYLYYRLCR